jgi:hypothetical protein
VHLPDSGKHSSGAERPVFNQENTRARARSLVSSKEKEKERKGRVGLAQNPARFFSWPPPSQKGQKALGSAVGVSGTVFLLVIARHRSGLRQARFIWECLISNEAKCGIFYRSCLFGEVLTPPAFRAHFLNFGLLGQWVESVQAALQEPKETKKGQKTPKNAKRPKRPKTPKFTHLGEGGKHPKLLISLALHPEAG